MKLIALVLPGVQRGRERREYACRKCIGSALDQYPTVMRLEEHDARPDERCPQCGTGPT